MNYTDGQDNDDWMSFSIHEPPDLLPPMGSITHSSTPVPVGLFPPATMEHHNQQHQHQHQPHQPHGSSSSVTDSPQLMPSVQLQQQPIIRQPQPQMPRRSSNVMMPSNVLSPHHRSSSASRVSSLRPVSDMQRSAFIQQFSNVGERFTGLEARLTQSDTLIASLAEDLKQMVLYLKSFEQLFEELGMKPRGNELSGMTPAS